MSAEEFEEWRVMFANEELHPRVNALRHAQLLAAIHNGQWRRKDKKPWTSPDFIKADPWAPPPAKKPPPSPAQLMAQVASMNASRRKK